MRLPGPAVVVVGWRSCAARRLQKHVQCRAGQGRHIPLAPLLHSTHHPSACNAHLPPCCRWACWCQAATAPLSSAPPTSFSPSSLSGWRRRWEGRARCGGRWLLSVGAATGWAAAACTGLLAHEACSRQHAHRSGLHLLKTCTSFWPPPLHDRLSVNSILPTQSQKRERKANKDYGKNFKAQPSKEDKQAKRKQILASIGGCWARCFVPVARLPL